MSFDFSALITDRTQEDVTKKTTKGFYNASDLNRVTACMEYLDEELRELGYESGYTPIVIHLQEEPQPEPLDPYTWYESDVPTASQMDQYLSNVAAIRSVFELPEYAPQTPQSMALLTFAKANDIESVLQTVENVIERVRGSLDLGWALGIAHIGLYGGV